MPVRPQKWLLKKDISIIFKIGHRGTRGLMPENTIPAMEVGLAEGANTVEIDVHITKDGKVIVYHDESFNPDYTLMPDGGPIPVGDRKKYTFYQNNYDVLRSFDIGTKPYPAYPKQKRTKTYAPLMGELVDAVDAYTKANKMAPAYFLIEVKSAEKTDGIDQPAPEEFMKIVMAELDTKKLGSRLIMQSFDMRPLQVLHRTHPNVALGYLTSDKTTTFEGDIAKLGFNPTFYNPTYKLVTADMVKKCHDKGILITPWTVNTVADMKAVKALGVDGIITDYPNFFRAL
ncbi:glycerophosphodiester phosphodiesterase family protein [Mucilaginibacter antarcticus]|uniref:glycerophosphodiester phosphodiesterase family protein n=1 Tax=Mucilaginibacter antarcticus TaxID=1855725 RepID=UPI0036317FF8